MNFGLSGATETMATMSVPSRISPLPTAEVRVPVALPAGALILLGDRRSGGLTWIGKYPHEASVVAALIRRALSCEEELP
jgi:hypothetical protein